MYQFETLPFIYVYAVPMFIYWLMVCFMVSMLMFSKMMSRKTRLGVYITTILCAGVMLAGYPHAVMPIRRVLVTLGGGAPILDLLSVVSLLVLLVLSSVAMGRLFCGFACPVGALQELLSKINFKSDLEAQKEAKYRIETSSKKANIVRWIFFGVLFLLAGVSSIQLLEIMDPLSGLLIFKPPFFTIAILIPIISLIVVLITSIFIYRPWCRFFCPFGALSSLCGRYSQSNNHRNEDCNECGLCEKICPTQEAFADSKKGECYYCNRCMDICPQNAIEFKAG